jgi:aryl-phospho-beta-D-glucosidase BglC (GH1 family)
MILEMRLSILLIILPVVESIVKGINIYGFETEHSSLACDWVSSYDEILENVQNLGFNTVRLPFSHDYIHNTNMSSMDSFFDAILKTQLDVVLDFHRLVNYQQSAKPYDDQHSFQQFLDDWVFIADRYQYNSHLIALDLFNEWQGNDCQEWNQLATEVINVLESKFPYRFSYMVGCPSWGSDCSDVSITLPYQDRIFYSIHRYIWHGSNDHDSWDHHFGNIGIDGNKMIVGEYGWKSDLPNQVVWAREFLDYLKSRNIRNSFFWCYGVSGDTGGIMKDDCKTVEWDKIKLLYEYWS